MNREEEAYHEQEMQYRVQEAQYLQECNRSMHEEKSRFNKNSYVVNLLSDSLKALKWMHENMAVIDKNLQSDAFNIPANAISQLEDYLQDWSIVYNEKVAESKDGFVDGDDLPF